MMERFELKCRLHYSLTMRFSYNFHAKSEKKKAWFYVCICVHYDPENGVDCAKRISQYMRVHLCVGGKTPFILFLSFADNSFISRLNTQTGSHNFSVTFKGSFEVMCTLLLWDLYCLSNFVMGKSIHSCERTRERELAFCHASFSSLPSTSAH